MGHSDPGPPELPSRPEPSWPTVIATTLRLWLERHPVVIGRWTIRLWPLPRRHLAALALAAGLFAAGAGAAWLAIAPGQSGDGPGPAAVLPAPAGPIAGVGHSGGGSTPVPAALIIPAIGVQTSLVRLGLTAAGALQVPPTTTVAGWYTGSSRPGAVGPAVIAGHIDSRSGPAVFFHLSQLRPGEEVYVRRSDGTLAVFRVTSVRSYSKDHFPTLAVYGPTPDAELRLITCGGTFDPALGSYLSNTVVYAAQVGRGLG